MAKDENKCRKMNRASDTWETPLGVPKGDYEGSQKEKTDGKKGGRSIRKFKEMLEHL